MTPLAELREVSRSFTLGGVTAIDRLSLTVARGEWLAVVGPSGSGKSTLLHMLSGLDRPSSGHVLFDGREPSQAEWTRLRATRIGYVFQSFHLLPRLTALENVQVPMVGSRSNAAQRRARATELLEAVGLAERAGHRPGELSGGERQRVAIARGLVNRPEMLLADEPTGNLDADTAQQMVQLLKLLHERLGLALVVVTHNPEVALAAGRLLCLRSGRLVTEAAA